MEAETGLVWRVRTATPRLQYVLSTLFGEWLKLSYCIVSGDQWDSFVVPTGWRVISYGTDEVGFADAYLPYSGFLERKGTSFFLPEWDDKGFFPGMGSFPWDLPAMAFYVLTLYPLYKWPYGYDEWGLYAWHRSPFYDAPFWKTPFLLERLYELLDHLAIRWPRPSFHWEIGWDIDHLYAWRGRGGIRWWMGGIRRGDLLQRIQVKWGLLADPYDTFSQITQTFSPSHSRFFFLLSNKHPRDSLISPHCMELPQRVRMLQEQGYEIGLHPSFRTREEPELLLKEKALLESYLGCAVTQSRQHYLRFFWPDLLENLLKVGIQEDFSLAFPDRSGFLLGTTLPVPAYRVDTERRVPLRLIGPALMDRVYLRRKDVLLLEEEIRRLFNVVQKIGGRLHLIWHNSTWSALPLSLFEEVAIQ
ncbi:MAG: hypothetical protein N2170_05560 [Bacteroidia bacterium]|nr:hypothetical protein [Bacteroidia bacterium]